MFISYHTTWKGFSQQKPTRSELKTIDRSFRNKGFRIYSRLFELVEVAKKTSDKKTTQNTNIGYMRLCPVEVWKDIDNNRWKWKRIVSNEQ